MAYAHQIIYTSCRRGIESAGDGLQVFSYDGSLPEAGFDVGVGFHRLLPFDVPRWVGESSFGYTPVEGCGAVWATNTKLAHDYMGPGGRAGNVLRHAVAMPLEDLDFYPVGLAYADFWRHSMHFEEVNSEEPPLLLPMVEAEPSSVLEEREIRWSLTGVREMEAAALLARAAVHAASAGRAIAISDDAEEALRWVALATYSLPLTLARQVSFVVGCDNLATAGAALCGITQSDFDAYTPGYMRASCLTFDPASCQLEDPAGLLEPLDFEDDPLPREVPGAAFAQLVERGWRELPEELERFRDLCERDLELNLDLADMDAAVQVYVATRMGLYRAADPAATLAFIEQRGSDELKREIAASALESLPKFDTAMQEAVVRFAMRCWRGFDMTGRRYLQAAISTMMTVEPNKTYAFLDVLARITGQSEEADEAPSLHEMQQFLHGAPAAGQAAHPFACRQGGKASGKKEHRPLLGGRGGFPFGKGKGKR